MILEVCCSTISDVHAAVAGGADRVELCQALPTGGLSPSVGFLREARKICSPAGIKIHALIRPREGDFIFSASDTAAMLTDISICKSEGIDGVVIGALTPDNEIDINVCKELKRAAEGLSVTFSRAFDLCTDLDKALTDIQTLGCDRILSSGGAPTAIEGAGMLKKLSSMAAGSISIIAAAGITRDNFLDVVRLTGVRELHGSFRRTIPTPRGVNHLPGLEPALKRTSPGDVRHVATTLHTL